MSNPIDKIYQEIISSMKNGYSKADVLKDFYSSMDFSTMKLEVKDYGFDFLETMEKAGIIVEYVELKGLIHKYKLKNIKPVYQKYLLEQHIEQSGNVCGYYHKTHNNVFSFNLDNSHNENNTELTIEMRTAVQVIRKYLNEVGIEPLIINSGRGYHIHTRLDKPVSNEKIQKFMISVTARTQVTIKDLGMDVAKVIFNNYPGKDTRIGSLRLFGSDHIKNQVFSHVCTKQGVLNERDSWIYFADYINKHTITEEQLDKAIIDIEDILFVGAED
ncbi:hypothetical protein [Dendrosporobacter sp. 1207_IL3150]|uniref:hypothetical protein n=1 Tax=Dendrosporobacter sp. 1207_IL3150 TaxID=3084054 RepID=UPI002FD916E3